MSTQENKRLMQEVFAALAQGDGKPFVDAMADDFSWTITGHSAWSRTWRGKQAVREELFRPLFARFAGTYTNRAHRFIAEDDHVVVECRGDVTTKSGQRYDNAYCYVCRFADGKLHELTEYMDTDLATRALGAP
jgi:uncharacterized protein (TIGR02246 family)